MVKTALKAIASRFAANQEQKEPTRRLLIIIRLVDGDWVLITDKVYHQPRHRYTNEAKSVFRGLFQPKATDEKFCAKTKADKALHEALGFRRTSDIEAKPHFERDGIEWHPVILRLDYYGFDSKFIRSHAKLDKRMLTKLDEHQFAEKLKKIFPRD